MDEIVKQALAKWPNVPHCYGWLALDARGYWRMRDEAAQHHGLPGERIAHTALLGFINRNYAHDARGCWYFQNGPQRVYVDLAAAPYVAHTLAQPREALAGAGALELVLHTGEALPALDAAWLSEDGQLILRSGEHIALVDDRDMTACLPYLRIDEAPAGDAALIDWLSDPQSRVNLALHYAGRAIALGRIPLAELPQLCGFVLRPQAPAEPSEPEPTSPS